MKPETAATLIEQEFERATSMHPPMNTYHEAEAVIEEEFLELRTEVFRKDLDRDRVATEAVQLAAMCLRLLVDLL